MKTAFHTLEAEHQLEVVDRQSTTFRSYHKFLLEAQVDSRFFIREYAWTGSGSEREPLPELETDINEWGFPMQRIHGPLLIEGVHRTLVIDLGRTMAPSETVDIRFRHKMKDLNKTFEPRLTVRPSIRVRNRIKLRVILPSWRGVKMVYNRFTNGSEIVACDKVEPVEASADRLIFELEVTNPSEVNMGHKLAWEHHEG